MIESASRSHFDLGYASRQALARALKWIPWYKTMIGKAAARSPASCARASSAWRLGPASGGLFQRLDASHRKAIAARRLDVFLGWIVSRPDDRHFITLQPAAAARALAIIPNLLTWPGSPRD